MHPAITGRPILESGGPFPLYAHDVEQKAAACG